MIVLYAGIESFSGNPNLFPYESVENRTLSYVRMTNHADCQKFGGWLGQFSILVHGSYLQEWPEEVDIES